MLHTKKSGFSLIQLSVLLAVAGLIVASTLPGGAGGSDAEKTRVTYERMRKIEQAAQGFMARNQRRPYPADLTLAFTSANYGLEIRQDMNRPALGVLTNFTENKTIFSNGVQANLLAVPPILQSYYEVGTNGNLLKNGWQVETNPADEELFVTSIDTTVSPNRAYVNSQSTPMGGSKFSNPIVAGGVPTRTLGLPDEYGIDGFGRRMVYMVDQRTTVESRCANLQKEHNQGAVAISAGGDAATNFTTRVKDRTMWALLSYGKDGQGAMGIQGSGDIDTRIKTGNLDADTRTNAFYSNAQITLDFTDPANSLNGLIQKEATSTFDDLVWYDETTKNTCSFGEESTNDSLTITGINGGTPTYSRLAKGDFNGDKIDDLAVANPDSEKIHIIFGNTGKGTIQNPDGTQEATIDINTIHSNGIGGLYRKRTNNCKQCTCRK